MQTEGQIPSVCVLIQNRMRSLILGIKYLPQLRLSVLRKVFSLMGRAEKIVLGTLLLCALGSFYIVGNRIYIQNTEPKPGSGGSYREGILGQPHFINPVLASSQTDSSLVRLVFSGLYKYDEHGNIIPDLAENFPQISNNQKEYTVRLRPGALWHDGEAVTSEDILFTIETIKDPAYKSPYRAEWSNTSIEKIDDLSVTFVNEDISGPFFHTLTIPLIAKHIWNGASAEDFVESNANLEAIGSGPYVINSIKKLQNGQIQSIATKSFEKYYAGQPHLDTIEFLFYENQDDILNALHSREITGFGFLPFDRTIHLDKDRKNLKIHELPLPQYQAAFLNVANPILADKAVRKALSLTADRQAVIDQTLNGYGRIISGPILAEQAELGAQALPIFDSALASATLQSDGWKPGPDGILVKNNIRLELSLATNDFSANIKTVEILVAEWKKLGIKINVNIQPTSELTNNVIRPRKFDILVFSHKIGADPDPYVFWHSSQATNPGLNLTGFASTQADQLLSEARTTTNKAIRDEKYRQFQALIEQETPAIFLNQNIYIYAIGSEIQGFGLTTLPDPIDRFHDVTNWYIKEKRVWK